MESGISPSFSSNTFLGDHSRLDRGVYIHARPNGLRTSSGTLVMHGVVLHVYSFGHMPPSGICVGSECLLGEHTALHRLLRIT